MGRGIDREPARRRYMTLKALSGSVRFGGHMGETRTRSGRAATREPEIVTTPRTVAPWKLHRVAAWHVVYGKARAACGQVMSASWMARAGETVTCKKCIKAVQS